MTPCGCKADCYHQEHPEQPRQRECRKAEAVPEPDDQPEPYSLAEAEVIARAADPWWVGRIMRELDTVRAQSVELRKLLDEERRERRGQRDG